MSFLSFDVQISFALSPIRSSAARGSSRGSVTATLGSIGHENTMKTFADLMVLVFVVSSVLSVGLSLTVLQIIAPLRSVRLVVMVLIANFVVVPAVAVGIARVMSLDEPQAIGLILLGAAAGAPFLPKLVEKAKGDIALSVALMVLLMVVSLAYLPLVLPRLLPGVSVDSMKIAQKLFVSMILPLSVGLLVKARRDAFAARLRPWMDRLSSSSLLIALVLIPALNFDSLWSIVVTRAVPASLLFIVASFGAGFWLGAPTNATRSVLGFSTAARNIPAALIVGAQNFRDPSVTLMIVVVALLKVIVLVPLTRVFARRSVP